MARGLILVMLSLVVLMGAAACSDDAGSEPKPLDGQKPGTVRYVIFLDGAGPELDAYRAARAAGEDTAAAEKALRASARKRARKLKRKLKSVGAKVVETWYLTNALTIELPESNVPTLKGLDGVVKVEPDTLYDPAAAAPPTDDE